jgi:hypothetical protein
VRARLRRACFALTAGLMLAVVALPGALVAHAAEAGPATAADHASQAAHASQDARASRLRTGQVASSPVSVTITGMSPQWATPKTTVTVSGTVTNVSKDPITDLSVELEASSVAFSSAAEFESYVTQPEQAGAAVAAPRQISGALRPGQSARWSISFKAKAAALTAFGVYPLTAQVNADVAGTLSPALNYDYTYLPYIPARHGQYAKTSPASDEIAWTWPLIDYPLTTVPGLPECSGKQVSALEASLGPNGRLAGLLAAGQQYTIADKLTWAIDPALLANARTLSGCPGAAGPAAAASKWLSTVRTATSGQQLFATPYADVDLALILHRATASDVSTAFSLGASRATPILDRDLSPSSSSPVTRTAWPSDGIASLGIVGSLAAKDNIASILLSDKSVTAGPGTAFLIENGVGSFIRVLLYSQSLSTLLGSATSAPGPTSAFAVSQQFLAETALLAQQDPASPIVVAPPQRWQPPAGLAATVLHDTATAPWLRPTTVATVEAHPTSNDLTLPSGPGKAGSFGRPIIRKLTAIDAAIRQLNKIHMSDDFSLALAALESSAWRTLPRSQQLAQLSPLLKYLVGQEAGVKLAAAKRVTMGGLKGNVQVSIDNTLAYPVRVQIQPQIQQPPGGGFQAVQEPSGIITVPPDGQQPVTIHVVATQVGATQITLRLLNPDGQPLPNSSPVRVEVQATQFGNIAMIILASVLGLFVLGSAIRGARRSQPAPSPDNSGESGHPDEDAAHGSQDAAGTDTVIPERTEPGTAGTFRAVTKEMD